MKPMLAFHFTPKKAVCPCLGQPKLNGLRALWFKQRLTSRNHNESEDLHWEPRSLPHIFNALHRLNELIPNICIDGELYCHGLSLQKINSRAGVVRVEAHQLCDTVLLHIFDIVSHKPFAQRRIWLDNLATTIAQDDVMRMGLQVVGTTLLSSPREMETYYTLQKQDGYEGAMYRDPAKGYGFESQCSNKENRWNRILKRKAELDCEGIIIGMEYGKEGKAFADMMGALIIRLPSGLEFKVSSGVQIQHRQLIEADIDNIVKNQTRVRVVYDELSDSNIPLRGRVECIYDPRFQ